MNRQDSALEQLKKLRMDLTAAQSRVTQAIRAVETIDLDGAVETQRCPECDLGVPLHVAGCSLWPGLTHEQEATA